MDIVSPGSSDDPERDERAMRLCMALSERGMALASAAADEAKREMAGSGSSAGCLAEPVERFVRFSRAVRRAILLETRIADGGYEPFPLEDDGSDDDESDVEELLEDDLAGEAYRSVPDILADIRAELGLFDLGRIAGPGGTVSSRMRLNTSSAAQLRPAGPDGSAFGSMPGWS